MTLAKTIGIHDSELPMFEVSLTRQYNVPYKMGRTVEQAASIFHSILDKSPVEKLVVLYMEYDMSIIGGEIIAIGESDRVQTSFQQLMRGAVVSGVPQIIMGHNHISGLVAASDPDLDMTGMALTIGSMLGISVYDHIIVGPRGDHYSIFEHRQECVTQVATARVRRLLNSLSTKDSLAAPLF